MHSGLKPYCASNSLPSPGGMFLVDSKGGCEGDANRTTYWMWETSTPRSPARALLMPANML